VYQISLSGNESAMRQRCLCGILLGYTTGSGVEMQELIRLQCARVWVSTRLPCIHRYAPHNDVSVNDRLHIRQWSHKIIIL